MMRQYLHCVIACLVFTAMLAALGNFAIASEATTNDEANLARIIEPGDPDNGDEYTIFPDEYLVQI